MSESYLLDTDIIIYWLKNKYPAIGQKIESLTEDSFFISSISVAELYYGAYNSSRREENITVINELLDEVNVLDFDQEAGVCFGEIKTNLKNQGELICDSDLFIASIAISKSLTLVTNNTKHFDRIERLKIDNWVV
jgi:tRNA(fMet)-specific endonuclease VapC